MASDGWKTYIPGGNDGLRQVQPPLYPEDGAIGSDTAFVCFGIVIITFVKKSGGFTQYSISMRKPAGHKKLPPVLSAEYARVALPISGRPRPDVHRNVEHLAVQDAHQFGLLERRYLIVKTPQNAPSGIRLVILHEMGMDARLLECLLVVTFEKMAALVAKYLWLKENKSGYVSWEKGHDRLFDGFRRHYFSLKKMVMGTPLKSKCLRSLFSKKLR